MARLKTLPPRIGVLPPRLAPPPKVADVFYLSPEWRSLVARLKRERGGRCERCGSTHRVAGDHRVEISDGGATLDPANIELLCAACHNRKTAEARGARAGRPATGPMAHPDWFRKVHVPLTIVCGPPGAGKSTWVRERARPGDLVVSFDEIALRLFGVTRLGLEHGDRAVGDVLRERNERLGDLMRGSARKRWPHAWLIVLEPERSWRQWWQDRLEPARIVVLETPADECRRRIAADAASGDARTAGAVAEVDRWWSAYRPRPGDTVLA